MKEWIYMTLYDILEVSPKASKEVIEKAYKVLVKKYHPDLYNAEKKVWAEDIMKKLNNAYEILSDEEERKKYDIRIGISESTAKQEKSSPNSNSEDLIVKAFVNWFRGGTK
jgi:DnaJ-class molecular chaperone